MKSQSELIIISNIENEFNVENELRALNMNVHFLKNKIQEIYDRLSKCEANLHQLQSEVWSSITDTQVKVDELQSQTNYLFDREPDVENAIHHTREFLSLGISVNEFADSMQKLSEALAGFTGADTANQKSDLEIFEPNSEIEDVYMEEMNSYDPWATIPYDEEPIIFVEDYYEDYDFYEGFRKY